MCVLTVIMYNLDEGNDVHEEHDLSLQLSVSTWLCRICLNDGEKNIFEMLINDKCIASYLDEIANVKVDKDDGLPELICEPCLESLNYAVKFKIACAQSDKYLRNIFGNKITSITNPSNIETDECNLSKNGSKSKGDSIDCEISDSDYTISEIPKRIAFGDDFVTVRKSSITHKRIPRSNSIEKMLDKYKAGNEVDKLNTEIHKYSDNIPTNYLESREKIIQKKSHLKFVEVNPNPPTQEDKLRELYSEVLTSSYIPTQVQEMKSNFPIQILNSSKNKQVHQSSNSGLRVTSKGSTNKNLLNLEKIEESSRPETLVQRCYSIEPMRSAEPGNECNMYEFVPNLILRDKQVRTKSNNSLSTKLQKFHETELEIDKCTEQNYPPICIGCNSILDSMNDFMKHRQLCLPECLCPYCGELYNKQTLPDHIYSKHKQNKIKTKGVPQYICDVCGMCFDKNRLSNHRATHGNELPFKCDQCPYRGRFKALLLLHKHQHTGEKRFVCEKCGRRFIASSNLIVHMISHTDEKPFKCPDCNWSFKTEGRLIRHKTNIHQGIRPHQCPVCMKDYGLRSKLLAHVRKHHKEVTLKLHSRSHYLRAEQEEIFGQNINYKINNILLK